MKEDLKAWCQTTHAECLDYQTTQTRGDIHLLELIRDHNHGSTYAHASSC
jgi:hypothetical protein|eukprot:COSAG06_NODE_3963_length_4716_cov_1.838856_5_plen_50_part_00